MKYPFRRWCGLSWLGWLNFVLLQWVCVRLTISVERDTVTAFGFLVAVPLSGWTFLKTRRRSSRAVWWVWRQRERGTE